MLAEEGDKGGTIAAAGTPAEIVKAKTAGQHLILPGLYKKRLIIL